MLTNATILDYLSQAARMGGFPPASLHDKQTYWEFDLDVARNGVVNPATARSIVQEYSLANPDIIFGDTSVPVALAIRNLRTRGGRTLRPLLVVGAMLNMDGTLSPRRHMRPWIPREFLADEETACDPLAVCDLDEYRTHQMAMAALPGTETWTQGFDRAVAWFETLCSMEDAARASGSEVVRDTCLLWLSDAGDECAAAADVLATCAQRCAVGNDAQVSLPLRRLLGKDAEPSDADEDAAQLPDDPLLPYKLLSGVPDNLPTLTQDDHAAIASFVRQASGDVIAIRSPKGTNADTVALTLMANTLTEHILRGDETPTMVCSVPAGHLVDLARTVGSRPTHGHASPLSRWLPRIATTDDAYGMDDMDEGEAPRRRLLGPLSSAFLAHASDAWEARRLRSEEGLLCEVIGHPTSGDVARHADDWYVPKAVLYFLDCASAYLGTRVHEPSEAAMRLAEALRRIDQDRCELIDAYAQVCRAAEHLGERDAMLHDLSALRHTYGEGRKRLAYWEDLLAKDLQQWNPLTRVRTDQSAFIQSHALPNETAAEGKTVIEDVCQAYQEQLIALEQQIEELRGSTTILTRRMRAASPEAERCSAVIARLVASCKLDDAQALTLESAIDGSDVSLDTLDELLDQTVRPVEFWLALHVCEARWLQTCRDGAANAWQARTDFCPMQLVPNDRAVEALVAFGDADGRQTAADLLVMLETGSQDVACGLAEVALADRVAMLGSATEFRPAQLFGLTSEEIFAHTRLGDEAWHELCQRNLSVSGTSSLLGVAIANDEVEKGSLRDVAKQYGEIVDLRSALQRIERMHGHRHPTSGADDPGYVLVNIAPVLSNVLVPDSAWEQVGASKQNRNEALAIARWLKSRSRAIVARYHAHGSTPIAVLAPTVSQARMLSHTIETTEGLDRGSIAVMTVREAGTQSWPLVIFSATCGPKTLSSLVGKDDMAKILYGAAASASDTFVVFCGGTWVRSDSRVAGVLMRRSRRLGRLLSVARSKPADMPQVYLESNTKVKVETFDIKAQSLNEVQLRAKPHAISTLLERLTLRGDIARAPEASRMNNALCEVGLIERTTSPDGRTGWRPTPAGREVGILPKQDPEGTPYCVYGTLAEPVVASMALSMLDDGE